MVSWCLVKVALPSPPRWLLWSIRHGYAISFRPAFPQVQGHPAHFNQGGWCPCLALPSGTCVQTYGNTMCSPWTGCGGSRWPTPGGSSHYGFTTSTVHKTDLCAEVEPVRWMVFLLPWGRSEMFDQSRAVLLASIKRVGDLQAFSVDESCLEFGTADSSVTLRHGYVPKVPTTPFRGQVVNLQALPPEEADPALALLCPGRALRQYMDRIQSFRTSEQLFVCYGGQQKGKAVSKQRMAHWIVDAITLAYEAQCVPCPWCLVVPR